MLEILLLREPVLIFILRYEVLIENLMDPAHVPYAHHGIMRIQPRKDR